MESGLLEEWMGRERYDGRWGAVPLGRSALLLRSTFQTYNCFCRGVPGYFYYRQLSKTKPYKTSSNRREGNCFFLHPSPRIYLAISTPNCFEHNQRQPTRTRDKAR